MSSPISSVIHPLEVFPYLEDDILAIIDLKLPLALYKEELTLKDWFLTSIWQTFTLTLLRVCLTVALLDLRAAAAGVWLLLPPAGDWDLSLWGDDDGDFCFFFSPTKQQCCGSLWICRGAGESGLLYRALVALMAYQAAWKNILQNLPSLVSLHVPLYLNLWLWGWHLHIPALLPQFFFSSSNLVMSSRSL